MGLFEDIFGVSLGYQKREEYDQQLQNAYQSGMLGNNQLGNQWAAMQNVYSQKRYSGAELAQAILKEQSLQQYKPEILKVDPPEEPFVPINRKRKITFEGE